MRIHILPGLLAIIWAQTIFYREDFNSGVPSDWSLNTSDLGSTTTLLYNRWLVGADYKATMWIIRFPVCLPMSLIAARLTAWASVRFSAAQLMDVHLPPFLTSRISLPLSREDHSPRFCMSPTILLMTMRVPLRRRPSRTWRRVNFFPATRRRTSSPRKASLWLSQPPLRISSSASSGWQAEVPMPMGKSITARMVLPGRSSPPGVAPSSCAITPTVGMPILSLCPHP